MRALQLRKYSGNIYQRRASRRIAQIPRGHQYVRHPDDILRVERPNVMVGPEQTECDQVIVGHVARVRIVADVVTTQRQWTDGRVSTQFVWARREKRRQIANNDARVGASCDFRNDKSDIGNWLNVLPRLSCFFFSTICRLLPMISAENTKSLVINHTIRTQYAPKWPHKIFYTVCSENKYQTQYTRWLLNAFRHFEHKVTL